MKDLSNTNLNSPASSAGREYISLAQASLNTGISKDYFRICVQKGYLQAVKLGRNWFTKNAWVDEYIKTYRKAPVPSLASPRPASLGLVNNLSNTRLSVIASDPSSTESRRGREAKQSQEIATSAYGFLAMTGKQESQYLSGGLQLGKEIAFNALNSFEKIPEKINSFVISSKQISNDAGAEFIALTKDLEKNIKIKTVEVVQVFSTTLSSSQEELSYQSSSVIASINRAIPAYRQAGQEIAASAHSFLAMTGTNNLASISTSQGFWSFLSHQVKEVAKATIDLPKNVILSVNEGSQTRDSSLPKAVQNDNNISASSSPSVILGSKSDSQNDKIRNITNISPASSAGRQVIERQVIERQVIERKEIIIPASSAGRPADLSSIKQDINTLNQQIRDDFNKSLASIQATISNTTNRVTVTERVVSLTNKIDQLENINLIKGATIKSGGLDITQGSINIQSGGITLTSGGLTMQSGNLTLTAGNIIYGTYSTTTILANKVNAYSIATSTDATPFLTFDTANYKVGIGTTTPSQTFSISGNSYLTGGLGVGVATTTANNTEIQGDLYIHGALSLSTLSLTGSTTMNRVGILGDLFIGDAQVDKLTINAGTINYS